MASASMMSRVGRWPAMQLVLGLVALALVVWLAWCACVATGSGSFRMIVPGEPLSVQEKAAVEGDDTGS